MEKGPIPGNEHEDYPITRLETEVALIITKYGSNEQVNYKVLLNELSEEAIIRLAKSKPGDIRFALNEIMDFMVFAKVIVPGPRPTTYELGPRGRELIDKHFEDK